MKICFITGTRADYGLIKPVMDEAKKHSELELQIIATGAHLSDAYGLTYREIESDGFIINRKITMLEGDDSKQHIVKSMGREFFGLSDALDQLKPDLAIIPGDRYEMLVAANACLIFRIPIAHLYGGDVTEGAFDDSIRHAITKMAQLHFVTNDESKKRVIQLGENPDDVYNFGSPSLDKIKSLQISSKEELAKDLNIKFRKYNLLITIHPETLADKSVESQTSEFLNALAELDEDHSLIITLPNADPEGNLMRKMLDNFAAKRNNVYLFDSLGYRRYFSLIAHSTMVFGNSSSGIYEAPSFKIPTVNIGSRQKGRIMGESIINCLCDKKSILEAIEKAKKLDCADVKNIYGDGNAAEKIIEAILAKKGKLTTIKKFYDL